MPASLILLALALAAQTGDYRNPDEADPAAAAATDDAAAAAAFADGGQAPADESASNPAAAPAAPSQIVIPETPQPTLMQGATEPTVADPLAPALPLVVASPSAASAATDADAGGPVSDGREASVLVGGPKPAELMRALLEPPVADQLAGVPASLGDAVRTAASRAAQTAQAQAYWALSAAVAQYHLALQEADELATLRQSVAAPSEAWNVAAAEFDQRVVAARESAIASQLRLHRLMGGAAGASLPLPADSPHCGRYNSRYDEIFVGRDDGVARHLHELLPLLHAELAADARQVDEAYDWVNYVAQHRDPANDGTGMLRAYELMSAAAPREFISAVRNYNDQIAAYAELATPQAVQPDRLVSMLIRTSTAARSDDADDGSSEVRPAGAVEDAAGGESSRRDGGRTFAQRLMLDDFRPLARLRHRERSIVVRRGLLGRAGREPVKDQ